SRSHGRWAARCFQTKSSAGLRVRDLRTAGRRVYVRGNHGMVMETYPHPMIDSGSPYSILGAKLEKWSYVQDENEMKLTLLFDNGNSIVITAPDYSWQLSQ